MGKVEAELRGSAEEEAAEAREEAQAAHAQIEAAEARSRKVVEQCREDRRKVAEAEVEALRAELERVAVSRAEGLAEARRVAHLRDREAVMVQEQLEGIVREWKENL